MKAVINAGVEVDFLTPKEHQDQLAAGLRSWSQELGRGVRYRRLALYGTVPAAGSTVTIPGTNDDGNAGPSDGFMWSIRRLTPHNLGEGTLAVYLNDAQPSNLVVPALTTLLQFEPGALVLHSTDQLVITGTGLTAEARITVTAGVKEAPEFMAWAM